MHAHREKLHDNEQYCYEREKKSSHLISLLIKSSTFIHIERLSTAIILIEMSALGIKSRVEFAVEFSGALCLVL